MKTPEIILLTIICAYLSGCATSYQSTGFTGGYSETQLAPDVFRVVFKGNGYTSRQRSQDLAMLRAAEVVLKNDFTHFAVINESNTTQVHSFTSSGSAQTTGTAIRSGNYVTYSGSTSYSPGQTTTFYKPEAGLLVRGFKAKPDGIFAFDATFLKDSLRKQYGIK